jgi:hypothetical protein
MGITGRTVLASVRDHWSPPGNNVIKGRDVIGGVPRKGHVGVADTQAGSSAAYQAFDMVLPWMVGAARIAIGRDEFDLITR